MRWATVTISWHPSEEYIRFYSGRVPDFPFSDTHVGFEVVNGSFHDHSYFVEEILFVGIPLDTWKHAEVNIFVSIGSMSFCGSVTWFWAVTDSLPLPCELLGRSICRSQNIYGSVQHIL